MTTIWVTLLLLHQGHSLVPVIRVQLDEPVTFTCVLHNTDLSRCNVHWYKQSVGDNLKTIMVQRQRSNPVFSPEFSVPRFESHNNKTVSTLTILRTTEEDEGMYHCAVLDDWSENYWSGTYLSIRGNTERTSTYSVVQASTASDPVRPGDSVTLQCSVFSAPDTQTCPGRLRVYWFRAGSDASPPGIVYADGASKCEQRSESVKSCRHRFSNVSSSDAGTYHCAVATCGQILFGEEIKPLIEPNMGVKFDALVATIFFSAIFVIGCSVFICSRASCPVKVNVPVALQQLRGGWNRQQREEDKRVYSAVVFTVMKTEAGALTQEKAAEGERL